MKTTETTARETAHTPVYVLVTGRDEIKEIARRYFGRSTKERITNARLIAAAPKLLEALQGLLDQHDVTASELAYFMGQAGANPLRSVTLDNYRASQAKARTAIREARGEA